MSGMSRTILPSDETKRRLAGAGGLLAVLAMFALGADALQPLPAESESPNVVIIFADDLGYGDLGAYGHPTIRTPNLDRMASEGQRWTSFYSQAPVCSPSRAALLTGRIHLRSGMFGRRQGVFFQDSHHGLPHGEITLAEALKELGYATGIVGKWHLGHQPEYRPMRHGFDSWFGIPYSNDMDWQVPPGRDARRLAILEPSIAYWHVPLMRNDEELERPADQTTITRRYTEEAVRFIREHGDGPFFLYVPHTMPHVPLFRSDAFAGRSAAGRYGDVIEEIDWSVGRILETLREELGRAHAGGVLERQRPWLSYRQHGGSAGLLRQGKGTTWEGGMRVPGIFWWPGTIEPGVIQAIGATTDLFTTIVPLAGGTVPDDRPLDGVDLSPVLLGTGASPRDWMAFYRMGELYAYRQGAYKVHLVTEGRYGLGAERTEHDPPLLFHLGEDPGERYDLAAERPDVVADLLAAVDAHRSGMDAAEPLFDARGPQ